MSSRLTQNHFELFSLPERYALESGELDRRYRDLQRSVHPDRFASASDQERRSSVQQAARINEAYQVLKDPLRRGRYLLELRGHPIDDQQTTQQDSAFLMQQMELRENLGAIRLQDDPLKALGSLVRGIREQNASLESELRQALDDDGDTGKAVALVLKMQFLSRLLSETRELEADLEDELY
jgi:molecular chaperone HscB